LALRVNYQKFKKQLNTGGVFYAMWRGIKYFIFLIKWHRQIKKMPRNMICKDKIRVICSGYGIRIYWNDIEVTQAAGLNSAINTLGLWTDSSFADWQILHKGIDYFNLKVVFKNLPINQIWRIKIENGQEIAWQIEMEVEQEIHIDEARMACLIPADYKTWINNHRQGDFPCLGNDWRSITLENIYSSLVGVRFPKEGIFRPSLAIELQQTPVDNIFPIIQNSPSELNVHYIGFKKIDSEEKRDYQPGYYNLFSGKLSLFSDDYFLDKKVEELRQHLLQTAIQHKMPSRKPMRRIRVLLVNLPWQKNGSWGVRAGSRWPHIKDKSEGNYLPFPFFLAYATSLLQKNDLEAHIIDAIAEQLPEERFMEKILGMDFDYLVAETSVPSFYDDLRMLEKINKAGIPIILCGPNSEIYKPQFLNEHSFIDFVLYGEYEFSLLKLINYLQERKDLSGIEGLIYRRGEDVVKNAKHPPFDINLLPWPNREQLPMEKYWDLPGNIPFPSVQMLASRGCPFGCNFCLWPQVMYQGNHYRAREIKDVVNEMEYLVKERGFKSVYFDDDTFNIGKERMLRFCRAIKQRDLQNIPWAIMARPDLMNEEILTEMRSAGLWAVKYGVETISDKLLENYQKNMNFKKTEQIIKMTKNLGIKVHLTFVFGIFGETKGTIQETIDYALRSDPDSIQFTILTPFPGTRLFEELDRQGRILTKNFSKFDGHYYCVFQPDNLSPQDLEGAKRQAYRLWGDHIRKKRGFKGDIKRFREYFQRYGLKNTLLKTRDYLEFVWIKRKSYLNGKD